MTPTRAAHRGGDRAVRPPVRLYADGERDLLALRSDVPVSPTAVAEFADCLIGWIAGADAVPVYVTGLPSRVEQGGERRLRGVATGSAGALLDGARERGTDALGVAVESDPAYPDPEAA